MWPTSKTGLAIKTGNSIIYRRSTLCHCLILHQTPDSNLQCAVDISAQSKSCNESIFTSVLPGKLLFGTRIGNQCRIYFIQHSPSKTPSLRFCRCLCSGQAIFRRCGVARASDTWVLSEETDLSRAGRRHSFAG